MSKVTVKLVHKLTAELIHFKVSKRQRTEPWLCWSVWIMKTVPVCELPWQRQSFIMVSVCLYQMSDSCQGFGVLLPVFQTIKHPVCFFSHFSTATCTDRAGNLWNIWAPGAVTAWLRTGPGLRENKHYFSVVYLTFDFEGRDLVTLLRQTICRYTAVNNLKVGGMHNVADRKY